MTIWNLHGTNIQLWVIHSIHIHSILSSLAFICFNILSIFPFNLSLSQIHTHTHTFLAHSHLHIHSIAYSQSYTLARFTPQRANQLPDNLSHFLRAFFFVYSVCLYSYNNHFPNDYTLNSSNFLHFFTNNNWIVAPNFLSAHFFVIEFAIVFVTVSMHSAKQSSTTALKTWKYSSSLEKFNQFSSHWIFIAAHLA